MAYFLIILSLMWIGLLKLAFENIATCVGGVKCFQRNNYFLLHSWHGSAILNLTILLYYFTLIVRKMRSILLILIDKIKTRFTSLTYGLALVLHFTDNWWCGYFRNCDSVAYLTVSMSILSLVIFWPTIVYFSLWYFFIRGCSL